MDDDESEVPKYRVGMVAKLTGLSTHVLRVWERRYGAVCPQRTPKGGRLYTDQDLRRLQQLSRLVQAGHSISAVATLSDDALTEMSRPRARHESQHPQGPEKLRDQFLEAIEALDAERARWTIAGAALLLDQRELLTEVIAPILVAVGERWAEGRFDVAQEHAATATLRGILESLARPPAGADRGHAIVATPPGERHELGAMMAGIVAALAGYQVTYLGPDLPAADLFAAAKRLQAKLVLLSLICLAPDVARARIEEVAVEVAGCADREGLQILVGGAAAPEVAHPRIRRVPSLDALILQLQ